MEVMFILLPLAIVMAAVALGAFFWAVHRGQYDDLDTPRYRALFDDTEPTRCASRRIVASED
jgi:cbb3-type cytochrome oxidase maturation protein